MGVSAGAAVTGVVMVVVGLTLMIGGTAMFLSGPAFSAQQQSNNGVLGLGGSSSSSASFNALPLLGLVVVLIGGVLLYSGLKGTMRAFDRGKERDEGTRHHLTVKRE